MDTAKVAEMFDKIASGYDFLNRLLSLGIDRLWRKKLRTMLDASSPRLTLDVATGTGDLAIECVSRQKKKIVGIDISEKMLDEARRKIRQKHLDEYIEFRYGNCECLEFEVNTFDAVTVAFGVRNFENLQTGLNEIYRVLNPSGKIFILDFSMPRNPVILRLYRFYFFHILPVIGRAISSHNSAYTYLPESVERFPQYEQMTGILAATGFRKAEYLPLTFGIANIYSAEK